MKSKDIITIPFGEFQIKVDKNSGGSVSINLAGRVGITISNIDTRNINYGLSPKGAIYEISSFRDAQDGQRYTIPGAIYVDNEGEFLASERCVTINPRKKLRG